uniref:Hexosyltransferase n=1 Tax=Timema genevievae TaxID=629358 RepID=A0A7R9K878_TIMGE|nr:unnamed protein product [Timema genevievae]
MPYVTENTRVNMILPIATNDGAQALKFMEQYATVCMEKHDKTFLMLVLLYDPTVPGKGTKDDIFLNVKQMALSLSDQYKKYGNKIAWVSIKLSINSNYGVKEHSLMDFAVVDLVIKKLSPDSLIMMCQTNMEFRQDYLNRVRMNTILHWQVFSPLPFTEYYLNSMGPRNKELDINKNHGYYDTSFAKHISFYAMDYSKARNQVELDIPIIHSDRDVSKVFLKSAQNKSIYSIHDMFVSCSDLHVLRAVEPSLKIRYMEDYCSTFTSRDLNKCLEIRGENLGTRNQLAKIIFDSQINSL